jgi:hypothetical protein
MVINQLNVIDLSAIKAEDNSPVRSNCYGPKAFPVALQRVEVKTGQPHVVNGVGFVELEEDRSNLGDQVRSNAGRIVLFKEPLQAPMAKADDHTTL